MAQTFYDSHLVSWNLLNFILLNKSRANKPCNWISLPFIIERNFFSFYFLWYFNPFSPESNTFLYEEFSLLASNRFVWSWIIVETSFFVRKSRMNRGSCNAAKWTVFWIVLLLDGGVFSKDSKEVGNRGSFTFTLLSSFGRFLFKRWGI